MTLKLSKMKMPMNYVVSERHYVKNPNCSASQRILRGTAVELCAGLDRMFTKKDQVQILRAAHFFVADSNDDDAVDETEMGLVETPLFHQSVVEWLRGEG